MVKKFQKIFFSAILLIGIIIAILTTTWLGERDADANYFPLPERCHWELTLIEINSSNDITLAERIQFLSERLREWDEWEILYHHYNWEWVVVKYRVCEGVLHPHEYYDNYLPLGMAD